VFNASLGWWYYIAGRNDEAIVQSKLTIDIAPNHFFAYWVLGLAYARAGRIRCGRCLAAWDGAQSVRIARPRRSRTRSRRNGRNGRGPSVLADFQQLSQKQYVSPVNFARIYIGLAKMKWP
jgi:hypothetical protein